MAGFALTASMSTSDNPAADLILTLSDFGLDRIAETRSAIATASLAYHTPHGGPIIGSLPTRSRRKSTLCKLRKSDGIWSAI